MKNNNSIYLPNVQNSHFRYKIDKILKTALKF